MLLFEGIYVLAKDFLIVSNTLTLTVTCSRSQLNTHDLLIDPNFRKEKLVNQVSIIIVDNLRLDM